MPRQINRIAGSDDANCENTSPSCLKKFWCPSCVSPPSHYRVTFLNEPSRVEILNEKVICKKCGGECVKTDTKSSFLKTYPKSAEAVMLINDPDREPLIAR